MNVHYYKGISGIYFKKIISNIIRMGSLNKTKKTILDFGCGSKILSKSLPGQKILNYDKNLTFSDHKDYKDLSFDIVVFNHVLMYMEEKEIISTFENIKKINKNCEIIVGIGKGGIINKLAALLSLNFSAHSGSLTNYKKQKQLINLHTKILKLKKNIFFMTDIYYAKFSD